MKHIPERSCIGCGRKGDKTSFLRIVRIRKDFAEEGAGNDSFQIDRTGRMNGRGAYLCDNTECLSLAGKRHSLERAFHCRIKTEVYDALYKAITDS